MVSETVLDCRHYQLYLGDRGTKLQDANPDLESRHLYVNVPIWKVSIFGNVKIQYYIHIGEGFSLVKTI